MRLHRLRASAFGPFAETVDLDLETLGAAGLYLVHGPTGSGKTSLLDAICFALYAGVPGDRQSTSLRSHHAAPHVPTEVELELTLADRRLRVVRHPAHERPKRRGTGTTTEPAGVRLEERSGSTWQTLSTRIDETAAILDDLLGMGLEQFRRVVMLPQGDFSAFLRATDEERRGVLERLFDISDYAAVEEELVRRRQSAEGAVKESRARLATHLTHLVDVLSAADVDVPEPTAPWTELGTGELPAALTSVGRCFETLVSEALTRVDHEDSAAAAARDALDSERRLSALRRRGEGSRRQLAALEESQEEHSRRRKSLDSARAAAGVLPHVEALARAQEGLATAQAAHEQAVSALSPLLGERPVEDVVVDLEAAGGPLEQARHEADALRRRVAELPRVLDRLDRATAEATRADEVVALLQQEVEADDAAREQLDLDRARLGDVESELRRLEELIAARRRGRAVDDELRRVTDTAQDARERAQERREEVQDLVSARLDNMAGELAGLLTDGEPCSVCGSTDHPEPARAARLVTAAEIDGARALAEAAEHSLETARRARDVVASRLEVLRAEIDRLAVPATDSADAEPTSEEADAESGESPFEPRTAESEAHHRLVAEATQLRTAVGSALEVTRRIEARQSRLARAQVAVRDAAAEVATARALRDQLDGDLVAASASVRRAVDAHADSCVCTTERAGADEGLAPADEVSLLVDAVDRIRREHVRVRSRVEAVVVTGDEAQRAAAAVEGAGQRLAEDLEEHGFEDGDAVRAAALPRARLAELDALVRHHDEQLATARQTLADPEVVEALDVEPRDLDDLLRLATEAKQAADDARRHHAMTSTVHRQFTRIAQTVVDECLVIGPAVEEADLVRRLADLVTGTSADNDKRMRLSTYVLAGRLERIVELANSRLSAMADGRYALAHDDASARGHRRGGLGLVVRDLWTGQDRPTPTLSGGESFTASLALALGLADAIREESGGLEFGTLFVDEGFGSLDQDSLEQVLDVLDGLRDGGRCVGVVSHVSEMRTRIPTQVRVDKTPYGSTVTAVGVTAA